MVTKTELLRTPLALAIMSLLLEHPMHPYEMKSKMKERGHDQVIRIKGGSLYDTVERLEQGGFIQAQETSRDGRRPEKTVYAITEGGRDETLAWLRELLAQPVMEYPQFGAVLAFLAALDKDEVVRLLRVRVSLLDSEVTAAKSLISTWLDMGLPRLFLAEREFSLTMKRAEHKWVRGLITDIEGGNLWVTKEHAAAVQEKFEKRPEGGETR